MVAEPAVDRSSGIGVDLPRWWTLLAWCAALGVGIYASIAQWDSSGPITTIFLSSGIQVAALLVTPRRAWPAYLVAFLVVGVAVISVFGDGFEMGAYSAFANLVTAALAAGLLAGDRRWIDGEDRVRSWLRFIVVIFTVPVVGAAIGIVGTIHANDLPWDAEIARSLGSTWYLNAAVACWVIVPIVTRFRAYRLGYLQVTASRRVIVLASIGVAVLAFAAMVPSGVGAAYVLTLVLVLVVFRFGTWGLALSMIAGSIAVISMTGLDRGPFDTLAHGNTAEALVLAQIYLVTSFAVLVVVAALLYERGRIGPVEQLSDEMYRLIGLTSGDTMFVSDLDGKLAYISFAAPEKLQLPASNLLQHSWKDVIHPDHLDRALEAYEKLRDGHGIAEFVCRTQTEPPRWMEIRMTGPHQTVTHDNVVAGVARDITGLARSAEEAKRTNRRLAALALTDPLLGIPNRRHFDQTMMAIWRASQSHHRPVSLLVIDIDEFKAYNDRYGHAAGDKCLMVIVDVLTRAIGGSGGFLARYGGDEFLVVLLDTDAADATSLGRRISALTRAEAVEHVGVPRGMLTVSVGAATVHPTEGDGGPKTLFDAADDAMYQAKGAGGDAVRVAGRTLPEDTAVS